MIYGIGDSNLSESRIVADYTDCADFKDFCLPSVLVRRTGVWVLGSEDANWKVASSSLLQKIESRAQLAPTEDSQKASGIGVPSYKDGFGT